jgi:hypothetical protein
MDRNPWRAIPATGGTAMGATGAVDLVAVGRQELEESRGGTIGVTKWYVATQPIVVQGQVCQFRQGAQGGGNGPRQSIHVQPQIGQLSQSSQRRRYGGLKCIGAQP